MITRFFNSFDEFEKSGTAGNYEETTVIRENGWIKADVMTECKSWKTALRRFFKSLSSVPELSDWYEYLRESAEYGCFKQNDFMLNILERNEFPSFAWEIEAVDENVWYIFLNTNQI